MRAVSTFGPRVVQNAAEARKIVTKAEVDLMVLALDSAANAAGDSAARQPISNLASAYLRFRDGWTSAAAPSVEAILADTNRLESVCRS